MRLVQIGKQNFVARAAQTWRSTGAAAFLSKLNGNPERIEEQAAQYPPRLRWKMLGSLTGVTLVAIAVRAPLLGKGYTAPDTDHYLGVAQSIFHGGFPDNLRPPGYALLLALFDAMGANPVTGVVLLQNLIGILLPAGVLLVGWRFFSPPVGLMASFLTAASPLMTITEQLTLADYFFGVALFAATVFLAEAVLRIRAGQIPWRLLIAAGVTFGIATLFRANGLLGFVAIPVAVMIGEHNWRPVLRASAVGVAAMLIVLAPWSLHNLIRFGNANVSTVGNISLYARVITWGGVPPQADSADGRLALRIYNTGAPATAVFNAMIADGKTASEASSAMGAIARGAMFQHPGIYLTNTWSQLNQYRILFDPHTLWANPSEDQIATTRQYFKYLNLPDSPVEELRSRKLPGDSQFTRAPWQIAQTLTGLLFLVTIGGTLILLLPFLGSLRQRLAAAVFLVVLLLGIVGSSLTSIHRFHPAGCDRLT